MVLLGSGFYGSIGEVTWPDVGNGYFVGHGEPGCVEALPGSSCSRCW
ncbi:hypothetical protein [Streptomyces sp. NPDC051310]